MRIAKTMVALAATTLMLAGCASQKEPAEKAVAQVESSLAEFRADAEKYAADELKSVEASVTKLKKNLTSKDYQAVVLGAPSVASEVSALKDSVAAKRADAESVLAAAQAEWTDLSAKMPQMVQAIQSRVDILSKSKKLPKDLDKAADAVRKARSARTKGEEILARLGMNS
jgi:hypothetical protein